jgi:16S rRNA (guanine966-N2)-methyltransferase
MLSFPETAGLRPTLGRTRETVFNWLRPELAGADCLDLFAGSGALGFEAASNGAHSVTFVECSRAAATALSANIQQLNAKNCHVVNNRAERFLETAADPFDIIFLDPPYQQPELLDYALSVLSTRALIGGYVYLEGSSEKILLELCARFRLSAHKTTSAGTTSSILATPG